MKINNLKYVTTALLVGGCILYTNTQFNQMKIEIQEQIDELTEKNEQLDEKIENVKETLMACQEDQKEILRAINFLLEEQNQNKQEENIIVVEEENNPLEDKVTGLVISCDTSGQYNLNFYKAGNKPYKFISTDNLKETLGTLEQDCVEDIQIVYLDGCEDSSILKYLSSFETMKRLCVESCNFSNLDAIGKLSSLEYLSITNCPNISDISPIGKLDLLNVLIVNHTKVEDISPLSKLVNLNELDLRGNCISNPSAVIELPNLYNILLDGNQILDGTYLEGFVVKKLMSKEDVQNIIISSTNSAFMKTI